MAKKATVTVALSNYNHAHYLKGAIDAITSQSRQPDAFFIIDDASTDNSWEIISTAAARNPLIRTFKHEVNKGVLHNANFGLHTAATDYIFFAAADDMILPGFIENSMEAIERCETPPGLACSDPAWMNEDGSGYRVTPLPLGETQRFISGTSLVGIQRKRPFLIPGHTTIVNRAAGIAAGSFIHELKWHCDWFLNLVVAYRHGIVYVPKTLSLMRVSSNTYSAQGVKSKINQINVLKTLTSAIHNPEYRDVRDAFRDSTMLAYFGSRILELALSDVTTRQTLRKLTVCRILQNMPRRLASTAFHASRRALKAYLK